VARARVNARGGYLAKVSVESGPVGKMLIFRARVPAQRTAEAGNSPQTRVSLQSP
jgi:hypothetical protein